MLIVPAIDLLAGSCVQLKQGDFDRARQYGRDAGLVAAGFERDGAFWIHVVDLDAARGSGHNRRQIRQIRESVNVRLQVGGGVRTAEDIASLLAMGADTVVVGTALAERTAEVLEWASRWPGRVVGGVDTRGGQMLIHGWSEGSLLEADAARSMRDSPLAGVVYTAVERDGMLAGPDIAAVLRFGADAGLPIMLSGGVGSVAHLHRIAAEPAIAGTIVGTAIHEGVVDLALATETLQSAADRSRWPG